MVENIELQPFDERQRLLINTAGVAGVGAEGELFQGTSRKLKDKERLNARVAMVGVLITLLVELVNGKSLIHMFDSQ